MQCLLLDWGFHLLFHPSNQCNMCMTDVQTLAKLREIVVIKKYIINNDEFLSALPAFVYFGECVFMLAFVNRRVCVLTCLFVSFLLLNPPPYVLITASKGYMQIDDF